MELLKLLSANEIVAQIVCFLILLTVLKRFMWGPFLKALDDRRARIKNGLADVDKAKSDIVQIKADYDSRLDSIEALSKLKIQEAVDEGARLANQIKAEAEAEAKNIVESARDAVSSELAKAKKELKDEIVNLAIDAASKVVAEKMTEDMDKKIVEDFLNKAGNL